MGKTRLHPAWAMLIGCCFLQFGGTGILSNSSGIFMPSVCAELGCTTGQFSFHLTLRGISTLLALPLAGKLIPRVNLRVLLNTAVILAAVPFGAMAFFHRLSQWYIAGFLSGFGGAVLFMTISPILLNNWFRKKVGLVVGIAMACSGLGGAVMNPLGNWMIGRFGWRETYLIMAAISLLCMLPFSALLLRFRPSEIGTRPYGYEPGEGSEAGRDVSSSGDSGNSGRIFLQPPFFLLLLTVTFIAFPIVFCSHFSQFAVSVELTTAVGASMSSFCMIGNISGKLGLGWLNDKISTPTSTILGAVIVITGFAIILTAPGSIPMLMLGALLYGVCMSMTAVSVPMIVGELFGPRDYSMALSYATMATSAVSAFGVSIVGWLYDLFGSYNIGITAGIVMYLILIFLVLRLYRMGRADGYSVRLN